jgi:hypothetical protein
MKHSAVAVCFLLVAAFSAGTAAVVTAGEPFSGPVQLIEGRVKLSTSPAVRRPASVWGPWL